MAKIVQRNEITFRAPTRVGLLANVTEKLFANGVNVLDIRAFDENDEGVFLIFTDDNRAAVDALSTIDDGVVGTIGVISACVLNEPGQLASIARILANADINVTHVYATSTTAPFTEVVLTTDDNVAALEELERL